MKKRDMENPTAFSLQIKEECHMFDLQGLCKDRREQYTMAIEAVDCETDPPMAYRNLFTQEELYAKACFARQLGVPFIILEHKDRGGFDYYVRYFNADEAGRRAVEDNARRRVMTETFFLNWWKARKHGKQQKFYRGEMQQRLLESFFDQLFEHNNSSWCGNIDGFLMGRDNAGHDRVSAVIECRFSNAETIVTYDPGQYYADDTVTWNGLKAMADAMGVPLYLMTYSKRDGEQDRTGITKIESVDAQGLHYKDALKPCSNLKRTGAEVLEWIRQNP